MSNKNLVRVACYLIYTSNNKPELMPFDNQTLLCDKGCMKYIYPLPEWFIENRHTTNRQVDECLQSTGYGDYRAKRKRDPRPGPLDYLQYASNKHAWFGYKVCVLCKESKPITEYGIFKGGGKATCKKCQAKKDWIRKKKKFEADPDAYEKEKQRRKKYPSYVDPDWYKKNALEHRQKVKRWKLANPHKVKSYRRKRHDQMEPIDNEDLIDKIDTRKCYWCGCRLNGIFHYDHIIPISKGGRNIVANLAASCPTCNLSKHAKMPNDFIKEGQLILEMT